MFFKKLGLPQKKKDLRKRKRPGSDTGIKFSICRERNPVGYSAKYNNWPFVDVNKHLKVFTGRTYLENSRLNQIDLRHYTMTDTRKEVHLYIKEQNEHWLVYDGQLYTKKDGLFIYILLATGGHYVKIFFNKCLLTPKKNSNTSIFSIGDCYPGYLFFPTKNGPLSILNKMQFTQGNGEGYIDLEHNKKSFKIPVTYQQSTLTKSKSKKNDLPLRKRIKNITPSLQFEKNIHGKNYSVYEGENGFYAKYGEQALTSFDKTLREFSNLEDLTKLIPKQIDSRHYTMTDTREEVYLYIEDQQESSLVYDGKLYTGNPSLSIYIQDNYVKIFKNDCFLTPKSNKTTNNLIYSIENDYLYFPPTKTNLSSILNTMKLIIKKGTRDLYIEFKHNRSTCKIQVTLPEGVSIIEESKEKKGPFFIFLLS